MTNGKENKKKKKKERRRKRKKEKEKERKKKKERKRNHYSKDNRIATLLYSTLSGVPVVSYCATPC